MEFDLVKNFGKEFDAIIKRIASHSGVMGVIVTQDRSQPIYTTMDNNKTYLFSNKMAEFSTMARSAIRQVDPEDDLEVVRVKTSKYEIMTATPTPTNLIITVQQYQTHLNSNSENA